MLKINEIFLTIQGESTYAGYPCVMVRLTGCNIRCTYCDSSFAFFEGEERETEMLLEDIGRYLCKLICITGGEPLLQKDVFPLMSALIKKDFTVLLETNGSLSIQDVPKKVIKIMDIKTPDSGFESSNLYENIRYLTGHDEVKFVICSRSDYLWAREKLEEYHLESKCTILFSPAWGKLSLGLIARWIIEDKIHVRLQLQLHKMIWPESQRGV